MYPVDINYYKYLKYKSRYNNITISKRSGGTSQVSKPTITRAISAPVSINTSLTAEQYVNYAMRLVKICIKCFNPEEYHPDPDKYLIFFDGYENRWELVRDKIIKHTGINYQCLLVTYEYGSCTDHDTTERTEFLSKLTRIRRVIDLCCFSDSNISSIFMYTLNRPHDVSQHRLTNAVRRLIENNQYPSLIDRLTEYDANIFNDGSYRYACGHSISGAYCLRMWQLGIFNKVYAFSPGIHSISILEPSIDPIQQDIHKGIDDRLVYLKVGSERRDSFVRIPITANGLKCVICDICGHTDITNCRHIGLFDEICIPIQKRGSCKMRKK